VIAPVLAAVVVIAVMGSLCFVVDCLLKAQAVERAQWAHDRQELLQRIQAPQHAVTAHYNRETENATPPAVDTSDEGDEDFWESREAMAERLAEQEVNRG
jgi:hypothetical protein